MKVTTVMVRAAHQPGACCPPGAAVGTARSCHSVGDTVDSGLVFTVVSASHTLPRWIEAGRPLALLRE